MKTAILLVAFVVLGAVAVAPTASADHFDCMGPEALLLACGVGNSGLHYALCYYQTAPADWAAQCV